MRGWLLLAIAMAGCGAPVDPAAARARVLDRIPAAVAGVLVADGAALSHARIRPLVEVARPLLPSSLGCAIDASLAADQVAVGLAADGALVIAIAARDVRGCPALSRVERGLWVATLGALAPAAPGAANARATFPRAARTLDTAPIAAAAALPDGRAVASVQPAPLAGWLAVDTTAARAPAIEAALRTALGTGFAITRDGPQVRVALAAPVGDLAPLARRLLAGPGMQAAAAQVALACPAAGAPIVRCAAAADGGIDVEVGSYRDLAATLARAPATPVVRGGRVIGTRLAADVAALGLARGDVVLGGALAGRLATLATRATGRAPVTVIVARGGVERALRISRP